MNHPTGTQPAARANEDRQAFEPRQQTPPRAAIAPPLPPPPPAQRRRWPWLLLASLLALCLLAVVGTLALVELVDTARDGMNITIDGERWDPAFAGPEHAALALLALAAALLVLLLVLPMVMLVVSTVVALVVTVVFGSGLLAVLVVAVVGLSPLWLLGLLLWLLLRRRPAALAAR